MAFNLLVHGTGWPDNSGSMPADRILTPNEYTEPEICKRYKSGAKIDFDSMISLPTMFLAESINGDEKPAKIGRITRVRMTAAEARIEYSFDGSIRHFTNSHIRLIAAELGIERFEFNRTHWAVKDTDLFQCLIRAIPPRRVQPKLFRLNEPETRVDNLLSIMMPFDSRLEPVHKTIKAAAKDAKWKCVRADDIWEDAVIIQDVVHLIDRSAAVICDCTWKNPNVFYEVGIAHTLGKEVIIIAQSDSDVPFDLRHLRYVPYLNNREGLRLLRSKLSERLATLEALEGGVGN